MISRYQTLVVLLFNKQRLIYKMFETKEKSHNFESPTFGTLLKFSRRRKKVGRAHNSKYDVGSWNPNLFQIFGISCCLRRSVWYV